jgi:hypothetical protein
VCALSTCFAGLGGVSGAGQGKQGDITDVTSGRRSANRPSVAIGGANVFCLIMGA